MRQYGTLYGQHMFRLSRLGKYVGNRLSHLCNHAAYGACSLMFVQTESYLQEAQRVSKSPVQVIPTGIDTNLFSPPTPIDNRTGHLRKHHLKDSKHLAIFVGRLAIEKNIPFLIRLYPKLKQVGIQLVLVGDGPLKTDIPAHIPVTGYLAGQQLLDAYRSADLLILPSHTDTIGLVVLEAMACGLPVVCSPFGGPAEVVQKTAAGAICDTADPDAFAQTCCQLTTHRADWFACATNAREFGQTCSHARSFAHMIQAYRLVALSNAANHLNFSPHIPGI
jgi:glycosyltransferase involved in cell wall biosynthesis